MFHTDVLSIIISYLDRCEDLEIGNELCQGYSEEEKKSINKVWLKESHIVVGKGRLPWILFQNVLFHLKVEEYHLMNGKIHRENDLPALICSDGILQWYKNGKLHRETKDWQGITLPALTFRSGQRSWWKNGENHRDENDLPASISSDGSSIWIRHGKIHRDGDKPAIMSSNGDRTWYRHGKIHRDTKDDNGNYKPASISDHKGCEWWIDGKQVNCDGSPWWVVGGGWKQK